MSTTLATTCKELIFPGWKESQKTPAKKIGIQKIGLETGGIKCPKKTFSSIFPEIFKHLFNIAFKHPFYEL